MVLGVDLHVQRLREKNGEGVVEPYRFTGRNTIGKERCSALNCTDSPIEWLSWHTLKAQLRRE